MLTTVFSLNTYAFADTWTKEYTEEIQRGVIYKSIIKYSGSGFSKLHVLECDLKDPGVSVGVMTASNGSSYLENTQKMAENNGALAAVNGDFFNMGSGRTNMLGTVYQDGEMVSTPSKDLWATFAVTDTGKVLMDYFGFTGKIISPQGYEIELYQINKAPSTGGAVNMFTSKWGSTVYCNDNMQAMLIKDGIVTGKVIQKGDIAFGDNDTMLLTNYTVNGYFDNFNVGDEVKIEYSLTGTDEKISEATGGNTILVSDGKRASFTNVSSGYAQRTAAGIDQSGTKLILAVCEGRQNNYKGMTQEQMADAMIELGCVRAINFDGGGSSTIVTKNEITGNVEVKNNMSSLRNVSTSVGIFNKSQYLGEVAGGTLKLSDSNVLKGDYIDVYYKFTDVNAHIVYPENSADVIITTDDSQAVVSGGRITFNTGGKHKVYAAYGGVTAAADVFVIDDVAAACIYPENLTISDSSTGLVSLAVWGSEGNKAYVHPESVKWVSEGVTVKDGIVSYGTGYIGVQFEGASAYCSVNNAKTPENIYKNTKFMTAPPENSKIVRISAGSEQYSTIANMIRVLNYEYSLEGADELYMFKSPLVKRLSYNSVDSYSQKVIGNTLIVTLDSSSGSINKNGQLENIIKFPQVYEKNIIVISENLPSSLSEEEREIFNDSLLKAKENGKNIFFVYKDLKTHSYEENGIYYIGCNTVKGSDINGGNEYYNKKKTVDFYISNDEISYSITN